MIKLMVIATNISIRVKPGSVFESFLVTNRLRNIIRSLVGLPARIVDV